MSSRLYSKRYPRAFFCVILLVSSILVVCNVGILNAQDSWWNPGWAYRKMIRVDHAQVYANLNGFPLLIDIGDVDLVTKAKGDGSDIVFTDHLGNKLSHEIESYDNVTGHLVCWVSTELSSSVDSELYLYYGNSEATSQENSIVVWDSGYSMVQHLSETQPPSTGDWHEFEDNPTLNGSRNGFASVFYDNSTGIYHLYCSWGSILHFTSSNGKTGWIADFNNPVLSGNNEGVPMVWKEEGVWYMLYRYGGPDKIGLANSTDASNWTRYEGNPVINVGSFCDPWGVIKVGSTYFLWYNDGWGTGSRCAGLATSTDLKSWTQDANNPIFTGGRFCVFPFKCGDYYYVLVPHYTTGPYDEIELYRDINPTFYSTDREYLGVVIRPGPEGTWDDRRFDTPCILTDTIYRDSYQAAGNELWTYIAGTGTLTGSGADWWTGMCIEQNITDALTRIGRRSVTHFDSTINHNDGQAAGRLSMNITGKIDGADRFNAATQDYINCGDNGTLKGMTALTVEAWVKPDLRPAGGTGIVAKWNSWTAGTGGSYILWQGSTGTVGWGVITETSTAYFYDTPVLQSDTWYHLVGTYDGAQIRLYINGTQSGTPKSVSGTIASTNDPCYIGRYTTPYMNGTMDEIRISSVARSPSWIQTEYNNQQNPSTFYTLGTEETQTRSTLSVNPSLIEKTPTDLGTAFDLNVTVSNVTDLFGFEFNLTWDNDLIRLINVDYENPLDSVWGSGNWVMIRNETGDGWYRLVAVSIVSGFTGIAGQPLTRLTFRVEACSNWDSECSLHFAVIKFSNSQANPILADPADGVYRIGAQKPLLGIISEKGFCRKYAERLNTTINIESAINVKGFTFEIHYNTTMLAYVVDSVVWGDLGTGTLVVNETAGTISGSISSLTSLSGSHWLLNLTFEDVLKWVWRDEALMPSWKNSQTGRVWFHTANLSYSDHADLQYQEGGETSILVTELQYVFSPIQGDTDNNGQVGVFDLRIIGYYYDVKSSDPQWAEASKYDLNGDNIIDLYDLVIADANFGFMYDC